MTRIKIVKNSLKLFLFCYLLFAICYLLTGCASVPTREALPAYNINGTTYLPVVSLCELKGINWEYDTFSRTMHLIKDSHKISLRVGDKLVVIDGVAERIKYPVDIYQGAVVVPYKFKEQILDVLFKGRYPPSQAALSAYRIKKIVIDAGHGGNDPGAIGKTGLREKDVNLDIARRLARLLRQEGMQVVMTRSTDRFIPLTTRVNIANNSGAGLFLSIHSNANRVKSLSGFEVYYVSPYIDDAQRALSSAQQAKLDLDKSYFGSPSLNLKAILWDMIYTYDRAVSVELANSICMTIGASLDTRILGIKGANFHVLKNARMPAVLIEVGFLSNYREERIIKNGYYRQRIAEGILEGVRNYNLKYAS